MTSTKSQSGWYPFCSRSYVTPNRLLTNSKCKKWACKFFQIDQRISQQSALIAIFGRLYVHWLCLCRWRTNSNRFSPILTVDLKLLHLLNKKVLFTFSTQVQSKEYEARRSFFNYQEFYTKNIWGNPSSSHQNGNRPVEWRLCASHGRKWVTPFKVFKCSKLYIRDPMISPRRWVPIIEYIRRTLSLLVRSAWCPLAI